MPSDADIAYMRELIALTNSPGFEYDPTRGGMHDTLIGDLDPFIGTAQQTTRMRAFCMIEVNGFDVTAKLEPHLISVHVTIGKPTGAVDLELDDRDGTLPLPQINATVDVSLGWETERAVKVFKGWIQDIEHGFGRKQGGRRMFIHALGTDVSTKLKEPAQNNLGEGAKPGEKEGTMAPIKDWLNKLTGTVGINATITGALGKIQSDYWHHANSSVMHEIETLSKDNGFTYLFTGGDSGSEVHIEMPGERGLSCMAVWRDNLIGWRVKPFNMRAAFGGSSSQTYIAKTAGWKTIAQSFGITGAPNDVVNAAISSQTPAATETGANVQNAGAQEGADRNYVGNGRIMINGEPKAEWNSQVLLVGARPGVDGLYSIDVVEHVWSRQGFVTNLEVKTVGGKYAGQLSAFRSWLPKAQPNIGTGVFGS